MAPNQMGVTSEELDEKLAVGAENGFRSSDIPVIDMAKITSDRDRLTKQVGDAAKEWGFFQIINHGIPLQELQDLQSQGFQFFDLPDEVKSRAKVGGRDAFYPDNRKVMRSALEFAQSLDLNPDDLDDTILKIWPEGNAKFRDGVKKFCDTSELLHEQILKLLAESLGLTTDFFSRHLNERRTFLLRFNFYPPCPEDASEVLGASSHTDGCCLTVLQQGNVGGLQIQKDGHWVDVQPIEGALIINVGDMLHAWTNGICKSVKHRVVVNKPVKRLTLAALMGVDGQHIISAPEELIDEEHPRLYRPLGMRDYIVHVIKVRSVENSSKELRDGYVMLEGFKLQN